MDYDLLWKISNAVRCGEKLSVADAHFIRDVVPNALSQLPRVSPPKKVRHAAGFTISGAPVRTFMSCALVLSAQRVLGRRYSGSSLFYDRVERDLAMQIMRSHFHHGAPKGIFCCSQCTLAVYPVLEAGAIRWFDSRSLATDVRKLIESRQLFFKNFKNTRMLDWSLGRDKRAGTGAARK